MLYQHIADMQYGCERSWQYSKESAFWYGIMGITLLPTAFLVERSLTIPTFDTFYFRLVLATLAIPLIFFEKLPQSIRVLFPYYWALLLTVIFPFGYSTVLVLNSATATASLHPIWIFEFLFSMFILVQFTSHTKLCIVLFTTGVTLGACSIILVDNPNWSSIKDNLLLPIPVYLTTFLLLLVSNRHIFKAQEEKLVALQFMASNIAHELRTPLATIRNTATGTERLMPILVKTYLNSNHASGKKEIRTSQLNTLASSLSDVAAEIDHANAIIDILLLNTLDSPSISLQIDQFDAEELVTAAVLEFPFNNSMERDLVNINIEGSFVIFSPYVLTKHVLYNLIKNALRHVQRVKQPRITIVVSAKDNSISVLDNGPGISKRNQRRIFQRFFSTANLGEGNGIGLSFCKIAMETVDGTISCSSTLLRGTEFKLVFPRKKPKLIPRIVETPSAIW